VPGDVRDERVDARLDRRGDKLDRAAVARASRATAVEAQQSIAIVDASPPLSNLRRLMRARRRYRTARGDAAITEGATRPARGAGSGG
jgi:hypothetical protein